MCRIRIMIKYTMKDSIKVPVITPITVDKSAGTITKKEFKIKKKAKQAINNIPKLDFFIILYSHLYGVRLNLESLFELYKLLLINSL